LNLKSLNHSEAGEKIKIQSSNTFKKKNSMQPNLKPKVDPMQNYLEGLNPKQ